MSQIGPLVLETAVPQGHARRAAAVCVMLAAFADAFAVALPGRGLGPWAHHRGDLVCQP